MSRMPAKKKSCFQITSVTQAQVAAVAAADDAESLDDPDESRTEDVSSEVYDVSRAEYEPACDRSSSEEALNAGEAEATANAPQAPQPPAHMGSPAGEPRKVGGSGSSQGTPQPPGVAPALPPAGQPPPAAAVSVGSPQPAAGTGSASTGTGSASTGTCSSRFRVIKLDHGTGEPFRRGRWTCTEFYERDSEASVAGRTADSMRHAGVTVDPAADRDSGSAVPPATHSGLGLGLGSVAETPHLSTRMHSVETPPQQTPHQNYGATGSASRTLSAEGGPQNLLPIGQNGLPQSGVHIQKSPIMTPAPPAAYPVHLTVQNQTEYYHHQQSPALPLASLISAPQPGGPSPASGAASGPSQVGDVLVAGGGAASAGQPAPAALQQQTPGLGALVAGSALLQQTGTQYAAAGQPQSSGVLNVPAKVGGSGVPPAVPAAVPSASSAALPNVTASSLPAGQMSHGKAPVALGVQGPPAPGFGQMEGGGRRSEGAVHAQSPVVSGREPAKPFMHESLQLSTPTVTSLFGIHIPVDGEEDSASGTNIVAIDNKIEQAMDLVKSHLMYAVREEVEVLKEQIKELYERNSVLERENAVLKSLANTEQLSQLSAQSPAGSGVAPAQPGVGLPQSQSQSQPQLHPQSQSQSQLHSQLQSQSQSQPQPQPHLQSQSQPQPHLQSQPQPQLHPQSQSQSQLQSQPQSHLQSQLQSQPQSHLQSQSQPHLQSQSHLQSQLQLHSHLQSQLQSQPPPQLRHLPKPQQLQSQLDSGQQLQPNVTSA